MRFQNHIKNIFATLFLLNLVHAQNKSNKLVLTPGAIVGKYNKNDLNETYDESIEIQCNGTTCISSSDDVLLDDGKVTISNAGTYIFGGDLNGQLNIAATKEDLIHLILRNATIASDFGPAIYSEKCKKVIITTEGQNTISDSPNYPEDAIIDDTADDVENGDDNIKKAPNACIFIKGNLTFNGKGSLDVNANFNGGIRSKKNLKFISGKINVVSKGNAIKAKESISIKDGEITIDSGKSGMRVNKDTDPEEGFIVIDGGKIMVKAVKDGIHAETHLTINDGYVKIIDVEEGIEGQMIDITGGDIYVDANNDGINASKIKKSSSSSSNRNIAQPAFPVNKRDDQTLEKDSDSESNDEPLDISDEASALPTETVEEITAVPTEISEEPVNIPVETNEESIVVPVEPSEEPVAVIPTEISEEPIVVPTETTEKPVIVPTQISEEPIVVPTQISEEPIIVPTETSDEPNADPTETPEKILIINTTKPNGNSAKNYKNDEQVYIKITGGKVDVRVDGDDLDGIDSNGSLYIGGNAEVYVDTTYGGAFGHVGSIDSDGSKVFEGNVTALITSSGILPAYGSGWGKSGKSNKPKKTEEPKQSVNPGMPNMANMTVEDVQKMFPNYTEEQAKKFIDSMKQFGGLGNFGGFGNNHRPDDVFADDLGDYPYIYDDPRTVACLQPYIRDYIHIQEEGTPIIIKNSEGKVLIERSPRALFAAIFFTSPEIVEGETYTVIVGDIVDTVTAKADTEVV